MKFIKSNTFTMYPFCLNKFPNSLTNSPLVSVKTFDPLSCIALGFTKVNVFPEPGPPITTTFLFNCLS